MTLLLHSWKFVRYEITKNTTWYFVWIKDASGRDTYVEFTKGTESDEVGRLIHEMLNKFKLEDLPEEVMGKYVSGVVGYTTVWSFVTVEKYKLREIENIS